MKSQKKGDNNRCYVLAVDQEGCVDKWLSPAADVIYDQRISIYSQLEEKSHGEGNASKSKVGICQTREDSKIVFFHKNTGEMFGLGEK